MSHGLAMAREVPADVAAALPPRPVLRPGWHVVRRDDTTVQIGLDPPRRVVAPQSDGVLALVRRLTAAQRPTRLTDDALVALRALLAADLVVDADAARQPAGRAEQPRAVVVLGSPHLRRQAHSALRLAGLVPIGPVPGTEPPRDAVRLVLGAGEPSRETVDALVRDDLAHLLVVHSHGRMDVGPLVLPGLTACLRCVDAHRAAGDPRRSLVVEQCARAVAAGATQPHDPALWAWALAWAARDLVRLAEGERPSTWSTSFRLEPDAAPHEQPWERHPACGCAWQQVAATA